MLDQVYSDATVPNADTDRQIDTLGLEARFHSIAARLLNRLSIHVQHLATLWQADVHSQLELFRMWRTTLARKFGLEEGAEGFDFQMQRNAFSRSAIQFLVDISNSRMAHGWGIEPKFSTHSRAALNNLNEHSLVEVVCLAIEQTKSTKIGVGLVACDDALRDCASGRMADEAHSDSSQALASSFVDTLQTELGQVPAATCQQTQLANGVSMLHDVEGLESQIARSRPYLAEYGGNLRNILLIHDDLCELFDDTTRIEIRNQQASIFSATSACDPTAICVCEHLDMQTIIERVWLPSNDLLELTRRVTSRVDIEWT
jgi:hypothetical protein